MADGERTSTDPFGRTIFFTENICHDEEPKEPNEIFDGVAAVIEKPILMFEVNEGDALQLYYYRSVGWHKTMLVTAEKKKERWVVTDCIRNPDTNRLSALMKTGRQLI
jgi:hypothetical protein